MKKTAPRDSGGKILPGQSGNPGGRPRLPDELKEALRGPMTRQALDTLSEIMGNKEAPPAARVKAATDTLSRAWGTPCQVDEDGKAISGTVFIVCQDDLEGV